MAAIIRFDLDISKMTVQGGGYTSLPLMAIISMMNKPNPFLCHPAVLESRNFAICFLSQLFYSRFGIVKI